MYILIIDILGKDFNSEKIKKYLIENFFIEEERYFSIKIAGNRIEIYLVDKQLIDSILEKIMRLKLSGDEFYIDNKKIPIKEINIKKIESSKLKDKIEIIIKAPIIFKIGSNFLKEFSVFIFFSWILRKYNKVIKEKEILTKENIEKIKILDEKIGKKEICLSNDYKVSGFIGSFTMDISELEVSKKELVKKIIDFAIINKIGYKIDKGFGKILAK